MSDYIASLEHALRDAAAREYPVREQRAQILSGELAGGRARPMWCHVRSRWWRSPLAWLLVVLAGGRRPPRLWC
jgi:hypothetical protein